MRVSGHPQEGNRDKRPRAEGLAAYQYTLQAAPEGAVFIAFMVGSMAGSRRTFSCILLYFLIIAKKKNSSEIVSFQRSFGGEAGI